MIRSQTSRKILVPCDGSKPSANAPDEIRRVVHACRRWCKYRADKNIILLVRVPDIEVPLPLDDKVEMMVAESAQIKYIQQM